jgi:hypothetical protein
VRQTGWGEAVWERVGRASWVQGDAVGGGGMSLQSLGEWAVLLSNSNFSSHNAVSPPGPLAVAGGEFSRSGAGLCIGELYPPPYPRSSSMRTSSTICCFNSCVLLSLILELLHFMQVPEPMLFSLTGDLLLFYRRP